MTTEALSPADAAVVNIAKRALLAELVDAAGEPRSTLGTSEESAVVGMYRDAVDEVFIPVVALVVAARAETAERQHQFVEQLNAINLELSQWKGIAEKRPEYENLQRLVAIVRREGDTPLSHRCETEILGEFCVHVAFGHGVAQREGELEAALAAVTRERDALVDLVSAAFLEGVNVGFTATTRHDADWFWDESDAATRLAALRAAGGSE